MRLLKLILTTALFTGIFYYFSHLSTIASTKPHSKYGTPSVSSPTTKKIVVTQLKTSGPVADTEAQAEEEVPWEELRSEFMADLEETLHRMAPENAKKIMATYLQERDAFTQRIDSLMKERDRYYYYDKEEERIVFKDKLRYTELNKEVTASFEEYNTKVEEIFADHYPAVMKLREQFEEYMQLYNRNEHRIGIGL